MADYTKTTNFLAKDSLPLNNAAKYLKGSELDAEFNNLATADADNLKISALGTGVETALGVNVGSAGAPVLFNGAGGTPSSMTGTNITGTAAGLTAGAASAVALGGVTGLGTGVATALAVNVGSAGAPVLFNGAGGTPSSMTGTNITGLPTAGLVNDAVTYAKIQNVSATDKLLGRSTAGAGDVEEIACTAAGRAILDDADATAQRATLGLVIGTNVQAYDADTAKLDVAQAFTAAQTFQAGHQVTGVVTYGYGTGSGGTVTQATSRTTGVTLDKPTGAITMFSAAGAPSWSSFTVTNSMVTATDTVILSVKAGATNLYNMVPFNVTAGAFSVAFASVFGTATDAPVINFTVIKGATS